MPSPPATASSCERPVRSGRTSSSRTRSIPPILRSTDKIVADHAAGARLHDAAQVSLGKGVPVDAMVSLPVRERNGRVLNSPRPTPSRRSMTHPGRDAYRARCARKKEDLADAKGISHHQRGLPVSDAGRACRRGSPTTSSVRSSSRRARSGAARCSRSTVRPRWSSCSKLDGINLSNSKVRFLRQHDGAGRVGGHASRVFDGLGRQSTAVPNPARDADGYQRFADESGRPQLSAGVHPDGVSAIDGSTPSSAARSCRSSRCPVCPTPTSRRRLPARRRCAAPPNRRRRLRGDGHHLRGGQLLH